MCLPGWCLPVQLWAAPWVGERKWGFISDSCPFGAIGLREQDGIIELVTKYSIVVRFHNEQYSVTELYDRLKAVMEANGETFELVFVDDGSQDQTFSLL